ncbi:MAG TPA: LacI family DNA-binding transcriptional regulator [Cellulomonas sp.]
MSGRKPTSVDVARAAGVSQSTVSYVLTGRRPISSATRRRVEDAIDRLGFVPNSGARALAGKRSQVIGLMVPFHAELDMSVNMAFVGAIAEGARSRDHDVLLVTADEGPAALHRLRDTRLCDAIILMDVEREDPRVAAARDLGVPVVVIGLPRDHAGVTCVDLDFESAGRAAVRALVERGHREVGVISPASGPGRPDMSFADRFLAGARTAAGDIELCCVESRASYDDLRSAVGRVRTALPGCRALVVHHSAAVEPMVQVLRSAGLVPGAALDLVGVCSPTVAEHLATQVDAVLLQPEQVSRRAMSVLFELLEQTGAESSGGQVHLVPAPFVPRSGG